MTPLAWMRAKFSYPSSNISLIRKIEIVNRGLWVFWAILQMTILIFWGRKMNSVLKAQAEKLKTSKKFMNVEKLKQLKSVSRHVNTVMLSLTLLYTVKLINNVLRIVMGEHSRSTNTSFFIIFNTFTVPVFLNIGQLAIFWLSCNKKKVPDLNSQSEKNFEFYNKDTLRNYNNNFPGFNISTETPNSSETLIQVDLDWRHHNNENRDSGIAVNI
ncbi:hypothetical protein G9A89_002138 [Geosiphon pyriformis]|nr:hypothetical protein G9A89_002138 [Geosiphon pyriformis]